MVWKPQMNCKKHCDTTNYTAKLRKAQTLMPPLQKPGHYRNQCRQLKQENTQPEITRIVPTIATIILVVVKQNLTPTK